jgi:small-conductance mechanosensitive channel
MSFPNLRRLLLAAFVSAAPLAATAQSTNAPSTNAPTAIAPTPIAVGDVVTQAEAVTTQLQQTQADIASDTTIQDIEQRLQSFTVKIDGRVTQDARLLDNSPSLSLLQNSQAAWQSLSDDLSDAQKNLWDRLQILNTRLADLQTATQTWQATSDAAKKAKAPADTLDRIAQTLTAITGTSKAVETAQNQIYAMQNRVAAQAARATAGLTAVNNAMQTAWKQLFQRDHPPLWSGESLAQPEGGIFSVERQSLATQVMALNKYVTDKVGAIISQFLLFAVLVMGFFWLRNAVQARLAGEPSLAPAVQVLGMPAILAVLLALLISGWIYHDAPPLLQAGVGAIALIPAAILIRRLIEPELFPLLYATVAAYAYDQARFVIRPGGVLSRYMLIFELLAAAVFALLALRSHKLAADRSGITRAGKIVRAYLHIAFVVFVIAGFANALGYVHLSVLLGSDGMLQSSYGAVILYACVRVLDAVAASALCLPPLSSMLAVRKHHDLIYENIATAFRWAAIALWVWLALENFKLLDPLLTTVNDPDNGILWKKHSWGSIQGIQLAPIIAFPITIWASFLLSRFIRFCLDEEVYPHMQLARGLPYAVSTVVHYTVLLIGFFIALDALGIDLSKFAVLAGAFGVGLGFGLQNIMNNFISGLILLFERPVKVGDTIQIDATTVGRVERIGIRASVILLTNGSELIMPNGNLISNPVTNWTLSNCERVIEIPVNITSKADPRHVIELLINVAKAHPDVIKNPPPQAVLTQPGIATQAYKLRAWIDAEDEWMRITSDLSLAINDALAKENITLA